MDLGLNGRRAAVAAASGGLGLGSARALLAEGARVAICGRDEARITAAAAELGPDAHPIVADVGTPEGATAFVAAARAALGGVDVLVTNAGGPPPGGFAATPVDAYRAALDLNLMSTVAMCHAAVPEMRERGWGRIVAITSVAVRQPNPNLILSNTARAGATAFLKTLAREVAADGVTVNSLQPGLHATDRLRQLWDGDLEAAAREVPTRTTGSPEDFGAFVAYLCSRQAAFVTGASIQVDGGQYAGLL
ncbi:3-oxoacyl-[acyl-carrier-protein] reductase FabG [Actinomadura rubteroloni]|uniref:3-oxoacyl-[acyl-carrier-protein] reductase FabG n=1 Tax=Actinomadura rubteroloni TaxID=1926885 RepID=A0A2P4UHH7_9ACTN|nr:SDR family oxidoreductase [Actinomadura rubteroloni]POM24491.1 3-oxoacyl-[acyl-carrier-protein] reductase FabG [Actinomadura rubteroloni]